MRFWWNVLHWFNQMHQLCTYYCLFNLLWEIRNLTIDSSICFIKHMIDILLNHSQHIFVTLFRFGEFSFVKLLTFDLFWCLEILVRIFSLFVCFFYFYFFLSCFLWFPLSRFLIPSTPHHHIAITLGRLGFVCPHDVAPHLQQFAQRWSVSFANLFSFHWFIIIVIVIISNPFGYECDAKGSLRWFFIDPCLVVMSEGVCRCATYETMKRRIQPFVVCATWLQSILAVSCTTLSSFATLSLHGSALGQTSRSNSWKYIIFLIRTNYVSTNY